MTIDHKYTKPCRTRTCPYHQAMRCLDGVCRCPAAFWGCTSFQEAAI